MNEPNSYPRSSTVKILCVVALGLFALNFSTAVSRHWGDVSFAHRGWGCPWHGDHMRAAATPAVAVEPVVGVDWDQVDAEVARAMESVDWDQIHVKIARAQREAARARCEARRFHREWEARAPMPPPAPMPPMPRVPAPPVPAMVMQ
ncbi:MAG TPA: hypothetical protein VFG50_03085 [Rhodothermales bacterium]|nr:hypothetical protein [Rhodothermales bacterium]